MLKTRLFNTITFVRRSLQKLCHIKTIGVRALVMNEQSQVLLVRHTYASGWHFPGGGVDAGETMAEAVLREAYEEAGIITHDKPTLLGVYYHTVRGADDYVALYVIHSFIQKEVVSPEIAECVWFDLEGLPEDVTLPTRHRLSEYLSGTEVPDKW